MPNRHHSLHYNTKDNYGQHAQQKLEVHVWLHPKFASRWQFQSIFFNANYSSKFCGRQQQTLLLAPHDASVMSLWHDDDRIITVQPMIIFFFWEKQVSVAPKDVYRPSIYFFPHHYPLALAVNKSPAVYILSPALNGPWRENRGSVNRLLILFIYVGHTNNKLLTIHYIYDSLQYFMIHYNKFSLSFTKI